MKININVDLIKGFMEKNKFSKRQFAKECGFSVGVLNKILASQGNFRMRFALMLARRMGVRVADLSL